MLKSCFTQKYNINFLKSLLVAEVLLIVSMLLLRVFLFDSLASTLKVFLIVQFGAVEGILLVYILLPILDYLEHYRENGRVGTGKNHVQDYLKERLGVDATEEQVDELVKYVFESKGIRLIDFSKRVKSYRGDPLKGTMKESE